jgi:predicted Fe-Mo cluster-binding NifX family protein
MNICIPVVENKGLDSVVSEHFGSAPAFLIIDTESGQHHAVPNGDAHHAHGMCQPLAALGGEKVNAIVAGGIGMGAFLKLQAGGIDVFLAQGGNVRDTVSAFKANQLRRVAPETACGHHGGCHGSH